MSDTYDQKKFLQWITNVKQEIENIKVGEGRWHKGAIHFEKGGDPESNPVLKRLQLLEEAPSQDRFNSFIRIASQDLGAATAGKFGEWGQGLFTSKTEEKPKPFEKPFDMAVKDGFFDVLRAAQVPMDPNHILAIEKASLRLAKAFEAEIQKEIKGQLDALVKKLEAKKPKKAAAKK